MSPEQLKKHYGAFRFYALGLLILAGMAYLGFEFGNQHYQMQKQEISVLNQSLENLRGENDRLTRNLNVLGVELEVQRLANQKAQSEIEQGMERESTLKQELSFYQKVMAPELKEQGFSIDGFEVEPTLSENFYRFNLILMQQNKTKAVVKGNLDVRLSGSEQGKPKELRLLDLMEDGSKPLVFSFKYFQVVEGTFTLPERFEPEQITVHAEVFQFRKKRGDLSSTFDWVVEQNIEIGAN